ncbi:MAG TPA: flagellar biosynthesis regulator FlaF [Candidatus Sulfotelmatobacter sp.]|nr:flagellar biosynthesis regulator FlaF [Candidatus Sulfotelmatobacter sp.]
MTSAAQQQVDKRLAAYAKTNSVVRTPREQERDVIALVTQRLRASQASKDDAILLARAISDNTTVWYILISDLSSDGNQLPIELRAQIVSVGLAVIRECEKLNKSDVDLDFLIAVNQAIIDGLSGTPAP